MAQTQLGAAKINARKIGVSLEDYLAHIDAGEKWCAKCNTWKARNAFGKDCTRGDGLTVYCLLHKRVAQRKNMKGRLSHMKGKHFSEEARKHMGRQPGFTSPRKGIPRTRSEREKISTGARSSPNLMRSESHYAWIDGRTQRNRNARRTAQYTQWRNAVFERDHYTCQHCGDNGGGNLNAHHIKEFSKYPELRFDVNNGITLCESCHMILHDKPNSVRKRLKRKRESKQAS